MTKLSKSAFDTAVDSAFDGLALPITKASLITAIKTNLKDAYESLMPVIHSLFIIAPQTQAAVSTTWVKVTAFTNANSLNNGIMATDLPNDKITISGNGSYYHTTKVAANIDNAVSVEFELREGGVAIAEIPSVVVEGKGSGTANIVGFSQTNDIASYGASEIPGDVELWVRTVSGTTDIVFDTLNLYVASIPSSAGTAA